MDACIPPRRRLMGLGGGVVVVSKNTSKLLPLFLLGRGQAARRAPVCFFPSFQPMTAFNPPPLSRSSLRGSRAGGVLAAGRRGHEYSK